MKLRLQIALLSALLTSVLLGACAYVFLRVQTQISLNRVDRDLRSIGAANLDRGFAVDHWQRLERTLNFMAEQQPGRYIMQVSGPQFDDYHRSENWPKSITEDSLPKLAAEATEPPEPLDALTKMQRGPRPPHVGEPPRRDGPPLPRKPTLFLTRVAEEHTYRIAVMGSSRTTFVLGYDLAEIDAGMDELKRAFFIGLPVILLGIAGGAWLLAGRALKPIEQLTKTVESVHAHGLDQRLDSRGHAGEFQRLIEVFNAMLARLERSFHQSNRFTADAAHELRTPLTILQGELELALQEAPHDSAEQRRLVPLLDEVEHLKAIVEKLLLLSQADAAKLPLDLQSVDLSEMMHEVIADTEILADGLRIEHDIAPNIRVQADPVLLHQLVQNLAANALRYNQPGGHVRFVLAREAEHVRLTVTNTGPGIPEADRDKIFQRFHRADPARTRSQGTGLGLAIAKEIATAHGGALELLSSDKDETVFVLVLNAGHSTPPVMGSRQRSFSAASKTPSTQADTPGD
ncbi:MAG: HAMP domain-containing protein [Verrucomicrobiaceae bacterium]|nr:HAMP domain-containing protein [Verrucomicrobiaceae bacterium]